MPRKARMVAAGALHHIIERGIEREKIFWDDADRDSLVNCSGKVLIETHVNKSIPVPQPETLSRQEKKKKCKEVLTELENDEAVIKLFENLTFHLKVGNFLNIK